jgi:hypothetical protein
MNLTRETLLPRFPRREERVGERRAISSREEGEKHPVRKRRSSF